MNITSALTVFLLAISPVKETTSTAVLQKMYARYHGKWHSSLKFNQTTERYRNDSLVKTDTWYESIVYPDLLRIDFGGANTGMGVIFRKDSTYAFRNNKIVRADKQENELVFFLGGLYFKPFDAVLKHFKELNYDLSKFHSSTWKGKQVFVLGANNDGEKVNQLWIDQDKLVAVRFIKYDKAIKEEGIFEDQVSLKDAWSETKCTFYINGHILQVEKYHDLKPDGVTDKKIFEPALMEKELK